MLDSTVKQRIAERYQKLNGEGKLLTRPQLDDYYATFRNRFGPEKLAGLDGEALLEAMHAHGNTDSLVYWLEFKNDDEFPSPQFGGIGGGSAFKFGVFRRKETGTWVTADESNNAKDLTVAETVVIARRHREQLIKGVEHLRRLPATGTDEDYRQLQEALDRDAPDVSRLGWGHKYFSLLFPEAVDDFHSPKWQRFHLQKMLLTPPDVEGRYAVAGWYAAVARELALPLNNLTSVLNTLHGRLHRYWRVGTSDSTAPRNRWPLMRDGNCVAVGWDKLGDLSWLEATKDCRERLKELLADKHPATAQAVGRAASQVVTFVSRISDGDYVLAADGATVLGVGRVTGGYSFDATSDFPHRRPVEWLSLDEWKMPDAAGLRTTVHEVKLPVNAVEAERKVLGASGHPRPVAVPDPVIGPKPKPPWPGPHLPTLSGIPGRVRAVLDRKGQVILYGPPGTGKTYWAEGAARDLAAHRAFGRPFDALDGGERELVAGGAQGGGLVRLCCFHPGYGYEDFIEGYRPETVNGQITFRLRAGVFKRLCADADQAPDRNFYLVVDEINRGDIPRIFGELLTVLEKDKRGRAVVLPVSGDAFRVPANVFLVGTMNTADRSISLLDAALRRRFGFVELMPDSSVLKGHAVEGVPLGPWLDALNRRICEHVGRDARNLQVGHSYLLQNGKPVKDMPALRRALRDDLLPLLEEYCYEDFTALQSILGHGLLDAANRRVREELFEDGQETALVQALLEPCPEVTTTAEAVAVPEPDGVEDEEGEMGEDEK